MADLHEDSEVGLAVVSLDDSHQRLQPLCKGRPQPQLVPVARLLLQFLSHCALQAFQQPRDQHLQVQSAVNIDFLNV